MESKQSLNANILLLSNVLNTPGEVGGAEEDRTPDLRIANATLSQLSYGPTLTTTDSETRTDTVNFISRFLLLSTF